MAPRREDLGSWLEGTPGDPTARTGLGLASSGAGSPARLGRRLAGILVDWFLSLAFSGLLFPASGAAPGLFAAQPLTTVAVFGVSSALLVALLGHTVGHRVAGLRVVRVRDVAAPAGAAGAAADAADVVDADAAAAARVAVAPAPGPLAGVVRSALLCLVIPAVVWDADGRGLHDAAAGTVLVRR